MRPGGAARRHGDAPRRADRDEALNANSFFNNRNDVEKPIYRYDTRGFTLRGPVAVPGWFNKERRKLFFFYSFENAHTENPQDLRQVTTPTERERRGDFSQTYDVDGYTWDLPRASRLWDNVAIRALFDNWQISGITAFASGTPTGIGFSTTDEADITGR